MNLRTLRAAMSEARRFLKTAEVLDQAYLTHDNKHYFNEPKAQGAVRRTSMDLTRSLAEMRKPG